MTKKYIFIYGTLKSTEDNFDVLKQVITNTSFEEVKTKTKHKMYKEKGYSFNFPCLIEEEDETGWNIKGELWKINYDKINILNRYESNLFKRGYITVVSKKEKEYKDVLVYYIREPNNKKEEIEYIKEY